MKRRLNKILWGHKFILESSKQENESFNNLCPIRTKEYGGLPSDGGFSGFREFGVGLVRAFEAAHCLLGSLGRHLGKNKDDWSNMLSLEHGHLLEEIQIIRTVLNEYSNPLYRNRMLLDDLDDYFPSDKEKIKENTLRQIENIQTAGPKLSSLAKELSKQFVDNLQNDQIPKPWVNLVLSIYLFVKELSEAAVRSVSEWPDQIEDPFSDPKVEKAFAFIEKYHKQLIELYP
jgi:hypothetical protein